MLVKGPPGHKISSCDFKSDSKWMKHRTLLRLTLMYDYAHFILISWLRMMTSKLASINEKWANVFIAKKSKLFVSEKCTSYIFYMSQRGKAEMTPNLLCVRAVKSAIIPVKHKWNLKYWGRYKRATILQTTFLSAFLWIITFFRILNRISMK